MTVNEVQKSYFPGFPQESAVCDSMMVHIAIHWCNVREMLQYKVLIHQVQDLLSLLNQSPEGSELVVSHLL